MDFLEPLTLVFMQRGLAAGVLVALACGLLGCFVVLRGMEYIGDAISHSVFPGVVVAYALGGSLLLGGLVAGLATALLISVLNRGGKLRDSTAIGVVFTGALALGVLLMGWTRSGGRDLSHFLFGNILGVSNTDLIFTCALALLVFGCVVLFYKELTLSSFDPTHARKIGIPVDALRTGLLILLTLTIVAGAQSVGVLLVTALLITPAATASLLSRRLPSMIAIATGLAVMSVLVGLYASYFFDASSGATIVLVITISFLISWGFLSKRV
ncbi:MAG: metal ABC transporter permease [Anaerolineae bacterium]|nr:metal ABC transporter permease [Anaerolineae bacterium]